MSIIALPAVFIPSTCVFKSVTNQRVASSNFGGSEQAVDMLNDRWTCSATVQLMSYQSGAKLESFIGALRGQTNFVNLHHFVRPAPSGTARGSMTLEVSRLQGEQYLRITGVSPANGTLLEGDMLGFNGMLVMVRQDATAIGGVIEVALAQRLRKACAAGTSVIWDKPSVPFRLMDTSGVNYSGAVVEDSSFTFGEAI